MRGAVGEHCLSPRLRGRVAQPPRIASSGGKPEGPANQGRISLVTFFGRSKKVTSSRAAPGQYESQNETIAISIQFDELLAEILTLQQTDKRRRCILQTFSNALAISDLAIVYELPEFGQRRFPQLEMV